MNMNFWLEVDKNTFPSDFVSDANGLFLGAKKVLANLRAGKNDLTGQAHCLAFGNEFDPDELDDFLALCLKFGYVAHSDIGQFRLDGQLFAFVAVAKLEEKHKAKVLSFRNAGIS